MNYEREQKGCATRLVTAAPHNGTAYTYIYDAEGRRVAKLIGNSLTSSPISNVYILGAGGEQLSELDGGLNWKHSNVYVGGKLLATYDQAGTHFQFSDWLGSRRFQMRADGASGLQCTSLPFGDNLNCSKPTEFSVSDSDATEHHFTGKERDNETGLDYFEARYYASNMGRMMSPDPSGMLSAELSNPQSWNQFSYALSNPMALIDPTGMDPCDTVAAPGTPSGGHGDGDPCSSPIPVPPSPPDIDPCQGAGDDCYKQEEADSVAGGLAILNKPCLLSAMRDVIAAGETPGEPNDGYGTLVRGTVIAAPQQFSDLIGTRNAHIDPTTITGHPHVLVQIGTTPCPEGCSTAYGRYQILGRYAGQMDFSRASQDAYANREMKSIGAVRDAASGNFQASVADLGTRWQSMPGSKLGRHQMPLSRAVGVFLRSASNCR